jgi:hypothetical protein
MKLQYFGDSYDIVKKSLLHWLKLFGPWTAHPMFTHATNDDEATAFSRFLGVPLLSRDVLTSQCDREEYFACCRRRTDSLFLDPDTGIRIESSKGKRSPDFVFGKELLLFTEDRPNALILTFDQSLARGREQQQVRAKLAYFAAGGVVGFAYVSHASFMLLGRSPDVVNRAYEHLLITSALPAHRIVTGEPQC